MNSMGNILWEEESAIISHSVANGNKAILINPIFQNGISLNNLTVEPDTRRKSKLYRENPSILVLINGNSGDS